MHNSFKLEKNSVPKSMKTFYTYITRFTERSAFNFNVRHILFITFFVATESYNKKSSTHNPSNLKITVLQGTDIICFTRRSTFNIEVRQLLCITYPKIFLIFSLFSLNIFYNFPQDFTKISTHFFPSFRIKFSKIFVKMTQNLFKIPKNILKICANFSQNFVKFSRGDNFCMVAY